MPDMATLVIEISAKGIADAKKQLDDLAKSSGVTEKSTTSMMDKFRNVQAVMQGPVAAFKEVARVMQAVYAAGKELVDIYGVQELAVSNLNSVLKATNNSVGKTSQELLDMASSLQAVTTFGDESIIRMNAILLGFRNITGDQFDRTTRGILDMATVMGTDLPSAAQMLGKALDAPTKGMAALGRVGFVFTDQQREMVEALEDSGDLLGAQDIILQEVEKAFGGAAVAAGSLATGSFKQLDNAVGDLKEQFGRFIAQAMAPANRAWQTMIENMTDVIKLKNDIIAADAADAAGNATIDQKILRLQVQIKAAEAAVEYAEAQKLAQGRLGQVDEAALKAAKEKLALAREQMSLYARAVAMNLRGTESMKKAEADKLAEEKAANAWRIKIAELMKVSTKEGNGASFADAYVSNLMADVELAVSFGDDIASSITDVRDKVRETIEDLLTSGMFNESDLTTTRLREHYVNLGELAKTYAETDVEATDTVLESHSDVVNGLNMEAEARLRLRLEIDLAAAAAERNALAIKLQAESQAEYEEATAKLEATLASIGGAVDQAAMDLFVGSLQELGSQLESGVMSGESFAMAMAGIGLELLNQLPMLFLSAGLQAIILGQWWLGLALLAAAGFSAVASGYAQSAYDSKVEEINARENATGGVYAQSGYRRFASGGTFTNQIVNTPTRFAYGGGFLGEMGEAGPEAIVPLARMPSGNLGVESGTTNVVVQVIDQTSKGTEKTTQESTDKDGTKILTVFIRDVVADQFSNGGLDIAMKTRYGMNSVGVRRS